jgi:hypothetical protein
LRSEYSLTAEFIMVRLPPTAPSVDNNGKIQ